MHKASVLFALTLYHDHQEAGEMLATLGRCNLPGTKNWAGDTRFSIHDATEIEGLQERPQIPDLPRSLSHFEYPPLITMNWYDEDRPGLPEVLNAAIAEAIKYRYDYVSWIHPDMDFSLDPLWLARCVMWLEDSKGCGKASPMEFKTKEAAEQNKLMPGGHHQGNACPWVMRTHDLERLGPEVFDPAYTLMHYEDWDLINRLQTELGLTADIIHWAQVIHEGMGTRKRFDYGRSLELNRRYYEDKWGMKGSHL